MLIGNTHMYKQWCCNSGLFQKLGEPCFLKLIQAVVSERGGHDGVEKTTKRRRKASTTVVPQAAVVSCDSSSANSEPGVGESFSGLRDHH
jgi:hypothetical protein